MALQVNDILNQVQTLLDDVTHSDRQRLLVWMNQVMKSIADMRDWDFLIKYSELTITDGELTLPADYKEFINLSVGDTFFYDRTSVLTDNEAWHQFGIETDVGIDLTTSSGTATLKYKAALPTYAQGDTTLFPNEFINALVDGVLYRYYQSTPTIKDSGGVDISQTTLYKQLYDDDIKALKKNYNRNQPVPKYSSHGYVRRRQ